MTENASRINGWVQVAVVSLTAAGLLVGATLWIVSAIHGVSEADLVTINTQTAIFARDHTDLEHRITTIEAKADDTKLANDRLMNEVQQLRSVEGDLTMAVQRLNDLLPERYEKKRSVP